MAFLCLPYLRQELEKIQVKFAKTQDAFTQSENAYKASVERYNKAQEEYNEDMTNSSRVSIFFATALSVSSTKVRVFICFHPKEHVRSRYVRPCRVSLIL